MTEWSMPILTESISRLADEITKLAAEIPGHETKTMTLSQAKAEFDAMTDEQAFSIIDRIEKARDLYTEAAAEKELWFRRKGELATRIIELQNKTTEVPPTHEPPKPPKADAVE